MITCTNISKMSHAPRYAESTTTRFCSCGDAATTALRTSSDDHPAQIVPVWPRVNIYEYIYIYICDCLRGAAATCGVRRQLTGCGNFRGAACHPQYLPTMFPDVRSNLRVTGRCPVLASVRSSATEPCPHKRHRAHWPVPGDHHFIFGWNIH